MDVGTQHRCTLVLVLTPPAPEKPHVLTLSHPPLPLLPVLLDAGQQRLQPARRALAVGVQEGDDLALGGGRAPQPRPDQPRALLHAQHAHRHLQRAHVVLQLLLQEVCIGRGQEETQG